MKKFLFTLFALLMAGSMFADNYFYAEDFEVSQEMLQNENGRQRRIKVNVNAHFDNLVSGWQVKVTLPEGVEIVNCAALDGMTIQGLDAEGYPKAYVVALSNNLTAGTFIGASQEAGYYYPEGQGPDTDDPTPIGANKWVPGDYVMFSVTLEFSQDFAGGRLSFSASCSCGEDPRLVDGTYTAPANQDYVNAPDDKICDITVEQPQEQPAPAATISNEGNVVTAAVDGEEAGTHTVELYVLNPETGEYEKVDSNPYTVPQTFSEQKITFKALTKANEGESGDTWSEPKEITIPAKANAQAPKPTIKEENGVVTATVNEEGLTVELYVKQGEEWVLVEDGSFELPANNTYDDVTYDFKAVTKADGKKYNIDSEEDTYTATVEGKEKDYAPTPKINNDGTVVTAAVENDDPEAPHTVVLEYWNAETEEWVVVEDGSYELPEPTFETQTIKFRAYTKKNGEYYDSPYCAEVTVTIDPKDSNKAPKPTIKEENGVVTVIAPEEGLEVELYVKENGEWKLVNGGSYTLPTNDSYTDDITVDFYAITKPDGEKYNLPSDEEYYTATVDKLDKNVAQKPTIVGTNLTNTTKDIVITPDPNTDGTLVVEANPAAPGRAAAQTMTYERKDADYYVHVKAWTTEGDTYLASEVAEEDILIPAKPAPKVYEVDDPTISVDNSDPTKTVITIEATEGVLTYNIDAEEGVVYTVEEVEGKVIITVVNGDETAFVNVTATTTLTEVPAGYDEVKNGEAEKNVEIPAKPEQTAAPTIDVSFGGEDGAHYANVTFVNNDAKPATIEYSLDNGETWNTYKPGVPVVVTTYGETTVLARATAEGKATSEVAERSFMLNDDATSVNELVNGKTVAGVRYFNMAGQEMQEANGITIVVTTYTDGTTSAVKVIK